MGKVLDIPAMGVIGLGALLPFFGAAVYDKVAGFMPTSVTTMLEKVYVKPAILATTSLGLIYAASKYSSMISTQTAIAAGTLSTAIFVGAALKKAGYLAKIPLVGDYLDGFSAGGNLAGGYIGGYSGGYLGYLGEAHNPGHNGMLYGDASAGTDQAQLFGNVGAAPKVNIF